MNLFNEQKIRHYFDDINSRIRNDIESLEEGQLLASSDEKIIEYIIAKYEIVPLEIYEDGMVADSEAVEVEGYDEVHFSTEIPFTGNERLWYMRPRTSRPSSYEGSVQMGKDGQTALIISIPVGINEDPSVSNKRKDDYLEYIKFHLEKQKEDVEKFNPTIPGTAKPVIDERKREIKKRNDIVKAFEIPLKQSTEAPDIKPIRIERKLVKPLPSAPAKSKEPEYEISDKDYEHIIDVIRHVGATFESTPVTYKGFGEEELRDVILANLNGHYKGDATGETFRNKGKTDIRIEFDNRAAFVGECKIWHGGKNVNEAIKQMLGYLTWRDCKTSIIIFNKNVAGFKGIQGKVPNIFETHNQYVKTLESKHAGECRYVLKSSDDEQREITVHVFLFDLYVGD